MAYGEAYNPGGGQRDRITQALIEVQNPPPVAQSMQMPGMPDQMSPQMGAAPPAPGAAPAAVPGAMPGAPPMLPQLGAATPPGMQPGGMLAQPQQPGMPPR